nr:hypothetical protein [Bacteroidota bacterium]
MKNLFNCVLVLLMIMMFVSHTYAQQYYFVMLNTNPGRAELPKEKVEEIQSAHMANMDSLAKESKLLAAGPFNGGGGLQVLFAGTLEEADAILQSDPAVKANRFNTELYPMKMNVGGICPVGEHYEMTEYQFLKYKPVKDKIEQYDEKKLAKLLKRHSNYMIENRFKVKMIADAVFGPANGGILVFDKVDEEIFDKLLKYDPWIKSELFDTEMKSLWIAKGSFCESR